MFHQSPLGCSGAVLLSNQVSRHHTCHMSCTVIIPQGDELDAQIRKAEKEVAALEATLGQLVMANGNYGSSFKKVDNRTAFGERAALRDKLDKVRAAGSVYFAPTIQGYASGTSCWVGSSGQQQMLVCCMVLPPAAGDILLTSNRC